MDHRIVCVVFAMCATGVVLSAKRIGMSGPYRIVVRRFMNSSPDFPPSTGGIESDLHFTHYKPGQLQYFWGSIVRNIEFNNDLKLRVRVSKWMDNHWVANHIQADFDRACYSASLHAEPLLRLYVGDGPCPIKPGRTVLKNVTREIAFSSIPVFFYGRWRVTISVMKEKTIVGFKVVDGDTIPKV